MFYGYVNIHRTACLHIPIQMVCELLNCFEAKVLHHTNSGLTEPPEKMGLKCDLDGFEVFDVCDVQHLSDQYKLPVAVKKFVKSIQHLAPGPSFVCSLPFIVYARNVYFLNLLLASSPFLVVADPSNMLQMKPTLVCVLAKATLAGDFEKEFITCHKEWKNKSSGVIFHPTWGGHEPEEPLTSSTVDLPDKLETLLVELNLRLARKLHKLKPELAGSLCTGMLC